MADVLPSLKEMIDAIFVWFDRIYTYFGAWSFVLGSFVIYTIYRYLLAPIVGGYMSAGHSDLAKEGRKIYKGEYYRD